jgi:hypothetical protein
VPLGSDDWVDHRLFLTLPRPGVLVGFRQISFVREDGGEITSSFVGYRGGTGIRIYPRSLMGLCGYRPADEDRTRACDTSILVNVDKAYKEKLGRDLQIVYGDLHERQIVDWKSPREQINSYAGVKQYAKVVAADPFEALADVFPPSRWTRCALCTAVVGSRWRRERLPRRPAPLLPRPQTRIHLRGDLDPNAERRARDRGDIQLLRRTTPVIQPGSYLLPSGWLNSKEEVQDNA